MEIFPYTHTRLGVGGRLDTIQAAVLLGKLTRFEWELGRRGAVASRYPRLLTEVPGVVPVTVRDDRTSVHAQYTVFVDDRPAVQQALQARGVPTAVHYPKPLHHQPAYAAYCCPDCCAESVRAAARVLSLPMSADLAEADQDRVVRALARAVGAPG